MSSFQCQLLILNYCFRPQSIYADNTNLMSLQEKKETPRTPFFSQETTKKKINHCGSYINRNMHYKTVQKHEHTNMAHTRSFPIHKVSKASYTKSHTTTYRIKLHTDEIRSIWNSTAMHFYYDELLSSISPGQTISVQVLRSLAIRSQSICSLKQICFLCMSSRFLWCSNRLPTRVHCLYICISN